MSEPDDTLEALDETDEIDEDEVQITLAQAMKMMRESWLNEKFAPEILPNKQELVDCLLGQINTMEGNIESLPSTDFQKAIYQMEVDRLRFLITSYLRLRLEKIENFVHNILIEETSRSERGEELYLTDDEIEFAKSYKKAMEEHFDSVLSFWPGIVPDDWKNEYVAPNVHSFVFAKSNADIEGVVIDDGNEDENDLVDFKEGGKMLISYQSVGHLVKDGQVSLI